MLNESQVQFNRTEKEYFKTMVETLGRVNSASPDLITLKIRSEDGDHTFILKMRLSETIGNVRRFLDKHR